MTNAFTLFLTDFSKEIAGKQLDGGLNELTRLANEKWSSMNEDEKQVYIKRQLNNQNESDNQIRLKRKSKHLSSYLDDQQHDSDYTADYAAQEQLLGSRFYSINNAPVEDISIEFFYKPHTLTLLFFAIVAVLYSAFTRNADDNLENNLWAAAKVIVFFFMIISVIAFPSGPFIRPHPVIWRMVFGVSVLYLMLLLFILFQDHSTIQSIIYWFFPELKTFSTDLEKVVLHFTS